MEFSCVFFAEDLAGAAIDSLLDNLLRDCLFLLNSNVFELFSDPVHPSKGYHAFYVRYYKSVRGSNGSSQERQELPVIEFSSLSTNSTFSRRDVRSGLYRVCRRAKTHMHRCRFVWITGNPESISAI